MLGNDEDGQNGQDPNSDVQVSIDKLHSFEV